MSLKIQPYFLQILLTSSYCKTFERRSFSVHNFKTIFLLQFCHKFQKNEETVFKIYSTCTFTLWLSSHTEDILCLQSSRTFFYIHACLMMYPLAYRSSTSATFSLQKHENNSKDSKDGEKKRKKCTGKPSISHNSGKFYLRVTIHTYILMLHDGSW